jgi:hypothetical protein
MGDFGYGPRSRHSKSWGSDNLKITEVPNGWALVNYQTPLAFRDNNGKVFVDNTRYSVSTSKIQTYLRSALADIPYDVVSANEMAKLSGLRSGRSVTEADGNATSGKVDRSNVTNYIMDYEGGDLDDQGTLELFSFLIKSGMAWTLQGHYGRTATALIDNGYLDEKGNILQGADDIEGEI